MGEKLIKYYKFANDNGGLLAKMELAKVTQLPSTQAAIEKDSPELIKKFKDAIKEITGKDAPDF